MFYTEIVGTHVLLEGPRSSAGFVNMSALAL